jgi:hypothetical protein
LQAENGAVQRVLKTYGRQDRSSDLGALLSSRA